MPIFDGGELGWVHVYITLSDDHAEIFHGGGIKGAFGDFERETVFSQAGEDATSSLVVQCEVIFGMDPQVVHIDLEPPFGNHIGENMIHEHLKSRRGIAESKKHYGGFEEAERGDERCFPLVFLPDANVVITPSNIKFSE